MVSTSRSGHSMVSVHVSIRQIFPCCFRYPSSEKPADDLRLQHGFLFHASGGFWLLGFGALANGPKATGF